MLQIPYLNPLPVEVKILACGYPIRFKPQAVTLVDYDFIRYIKKRADRKGIIELSLDRLRDKSKVEPLVQQSLKNYLLQQINPAIRGWEGRFAEQKAGNREPEITPMYLTLKKIRDYVLEIVELNESEKQDFEIKPADYKGEMFKLLEEVTIGASSEEDLNKIYSSMTKSVPVQPKEEKKVVGIDFENIAKKVEVKTTENTKK